MATLDTHLVVIGGGVVGCAVAHALTRRRAQVLLIEAETELALGASGANSGILHTGFDSTPNKLETQLILRSAALREDLLEELAVPLLRCGARLSPTDESERAAVRVLAENARVNGVQAQLEEDGALSVAGETLTDPVAFVGALAAAAQAGGATLQLDTRVVGLAGAADGAVLVELEGGGRVRARAAVNCAGLHADDVASMAGDELLSVYPRKGEFLVFSAPKDLPQQQILLPVPSALGKGVLVFPTVDRRAVIAGPTAREREDKRDWAVEADAAELILGKAQLMCPALAGLEPIGAYAGLRPAGRSANYVIERSRTLPSLIHVAAIRSTGLSASLAIGEHVVGMLTTAGAISPSPVRPLPAPAQPAAAAAWWERAILRSQRSGTETRAP
jgi:glycerol-3-phosphate dehydrogenase